MHVSQAGDFRAGESNMKIGDEVHYKSSFLSSIGAGQFAEVANRVGIVEEFRANGKYARVAWDDDGASTVLVSNIAKTKSNKAMDEWHNEESKRYRDEEEIKNAIYIIEGAIAVKQSWAQMKTS